MKHPAVVQVRTEIEKALEIAKKFVTEVEKRKDGVDIYFEDVNEARRFISIFKRATKKKILVKSSTSYAGLRKGRVRYLFTYSLKEDEGGKVR